MQPKNRGIAGLSWHHTAAPLALIVAIATTVATATPSAASQDSTGAAAAAASGTPAGLVSELELRNLIRALAAAQLDEEQEAVAAEAEEAGDAVQYKRVFKPLRGKKSSPLYGDVQDNEDGDDEEEEKREFKPLRGKRKFHALRGKRKFHALRGKRKFHALRG